jgi:hypothetical protein
MINLLSYRNIYFRNNELKINAEFINKPILIEIPIISILK